MSLLSIDILKMAARRMDYSAERQRLISQNIANADTPDYRPSDLKPMNFESELRGVRDASSSASGTHASVVARTDAGHLAGTIGAGRFARDGKSKGWEQSISGNGVVIEQEMLKAAELQSENALAMNVYRKSVGLIKAAIGRV
jgi:flagellar basal-body rod protein FlgB